MFWLVVVTAALSLTLSEWGWRHAPVANFYLLPARAWELLAGSIAAFIVSKHGTTANNPLSMLGLFAIMFAIFFSDETTPFPSLYALIPVLGTVLLMLFAEKSTVTAKILSVKVFVVIGLMSYSIYLWHQPLFALARLRTINSLDSGLASFLIVVTFLLAYLTWKFVETPVRKKVFFKTRKSTFYSSAVVLSVIGSVGIAGSVMIAGASKSTPSFLKQYEDKSDYIANNFFLLGESYDLQRQINGIPFFAVDDIPADNQLLFDLADDRKKIQVAGNSHSVDFYNVLTSSRKVSEGAQVARYGVQIKNVGEKFFSSPNYKATDVVIYCSLFGHDEIRHIERIIKRSIQDGKKTHVCENIFTWIERENHNDLDRIIVFGMKEGLSYHDIADRINNAYSAAFQQENFGTDENKFTFKRLRSHLLELSTEYDFNIINRMEYVCAKGTCEIVSDNLGKLFFDLGHHTLAGSIHFGPVIDYTGLADTILDSAIEKNE